MKLGRLELIWHKHKITETEKIMKNARQVFNIYPILLGIGIAICIGRFMLWWVGYRKVDR